MATRWRPFGPHPRGWIGMSYVARRPRSGVCGSCFVVRDLWFVVCGSWSDRCNCQREKGGRAARACSTNDRRVGAAGGRWERGHTLMQMERHT